MSPQKKTFGEQLCVALSDHNVIKSFWEIISDKGMEALGVMEDRLRVCEAKLEAKDKRIESLQDELKEAGVDILDETQQYLMRNSVRIQHPGLMENDNEDCVSLICDTPRSIESP